jgi:hypothetical protein
LQHRNILRQDYDNLWHLSNVSRQVRAEIGSLFWNNVYPAFDRWHCKLIDFFTQHPGFRNGIAKLRLEIEFKNENTPDLEDWIVDVFRYVAEYLSLDNITF